jgi:hypothetical protein
VSLVGIDEVPWYQKGQGCLGKHPAKKGTPRRSTMEGWGAVLGCELGECI